MSHFTIALSGLTEEDIAQVQVALDAPDNHWTLVDGIEANLLMVDIDSVWGHMDWLRATANGTRTIAYTGQSQVRNGDLILHKPLTAEVLSTLLSDLNVDSTDGELPFESRVVQTPDENVSINAAAVIEEREDAVSSEQPQQLAAVEDWEDSAPIDEQEDGVSAEEWEKLAALEEPEDIAALEDQEPELTAVESPAPEVAVADHPVAAAPVAHLSLVARARAAADLAPVVHAGAPASMPDDIEPAANTVELAAALAATGTSTPAASEQTLGSALLAGAIQQPVRIESHGIVLQIDPERGGYHAPSVLKAVQPLLSLPADAAQPLDAKALEQLRLSPALPLTRLLWYAALCSMPGELAAPLDRHAVYHLTRWPQIEREFPRHFRIATAMMKQPGSMDAIAAEAKAPVSDVIDFVNAYHVAGFIHADASSDAADSSVMSRLRRPFAR